MAWIVDGMNVIGSRPDGWWRDRTGAMRRLVADLRALRAEVTVVFDGSARDLGDTGDVVVAWAPGPGPDAADRVIEAMVRSDPEPWRLRVVTSDADLAARVRSAGARVETAGAFRRRRA